MSYEAGSFHWTLFYAGLTGFLFLILAVRVSMERGRVRVDHGTNGGDERFQRAVRTQVNQAKYVAPVLLMLLLLEMSGMMPTWVIQAIGVL